MKLTDRSRIIDFQRCPRRRYWGYEWDATGLRRARLNLPLLVGGACHEGWAELVRGADVEFAAGAAVYAFDRDIRESAIDLEANEQTEYVHAEQRALVEGLVRLAAHEVTPRLLRQYAPMLVEHEMNSQLPGADITLMGRADGLLKERETGDLYLLSWKSKATWDDRAGEDAQHDDQGLSETWLTETTMPELGALSGVLMIWLLKGARTEYPKGSGQWQQNSPLIRGWRKFTNEGMPQYAWKFQWTDPDGTTHKLGKGWQKFNAWQEPGGVKWWVDLLATGTVQPDAGIALASQVHAPAPYYRRQEHVEDWVQQVALQESRLDSWPQHRHSCSYPSRCPFYDLCWGGAHVAAAPLEAGYVRRKPHHEAEIDQWTKLAEVSDGK